MFVIFASSFDNRFTGICCDSLSWDLQRCGLLNFILPSLYFSTWIIFWEGARFERFQCLRKTRWFWQFCFLILALGFRSCYTPTKNNDAKKHIYCFRCNRRQCQDYRGIGQPQTILSKICGNKNVSEHQKSIARCWDHWEPQIWEKCAVSFSRTLGHLRAQSQRGPCKWVLGPKKATLQRTSMSGYVRPWRWGETVWFGLWEVVGGSRLRLWSLTFCRQRRQCKLCPQEPKGQSVTLAMTWWLRVNLDQDLPLAISHWSLVVHCNSAKQWLKTFFGPLRSLQRRDETWSFCSLRP